jgi:hypothetical protein
LTFCGDLLLCPLVVTFTRLRAVRRKGVNEHGPVQMSMPDEKFLRVQAKFMAVRQQCWTARRVVLVSAPAKGLKGVKKPGKE